MKSHELRVGQSIVIHSKPSLFNGKPLPEYGILKSIEPVRNIFDHWGNQAVRLTIEQKRDRLYNLSFYYHNLDKIEKA